MALTSLQACMDSSDWLQGTIHEDTGMDSSSPSGGDILTCSRPLVERRLRPQHDQALKCPRCDSTHTKFCYYNNYSLTQPRYFCKTCRRYWTKGGTLRNIPVGGGCRKNKKVSSKKSSDNNNNNHQPINPNPIGSSSASHHTPTDLQLSFPEVQFSHLTDILGSHAHDPGSFFMDTKYNAFLENPNPRPIDFMESKFDQEAMVENSGIISHNFMGNDELGLISNGFGGDHMHTFHGSTSNYSTFSSPYGMASLDHGINYSGTTTFMDTCHRLMLPNYQGHGDHGDGVEVKPNTKLLALEWQQDQGCADLSTGLGSWTGLINGYGSSATNPLV